MGRVRYLIEDNHWQTDGEWKESVIRQVLRRHLPASVNVGRGFVLTASAASHQIDVLVSDASKPVLFRDGDLAFVTPDAVLGLIEVKTRATPSSVAEAATKMASDIALVRSHPNSRAFAGLFAFEDDGGDSHGYLDAIGRAAPQSKNRLDYVCVGHSRFIRYWELNPSGQVGPLYASWHAYVLPALAPGYFIHNVVDSVSPESVLRNSDVWFPQGGKELRRDAVQRAAWAPSFPEVGADSSGDHESPARRLRKAHRRDAP
jgi:hypothetical protein